MLIMYRRIKLSLTLGRIFIFLIVCLVAWSLFIVIREREKNVDAPQQSFIQVVEVVLWDERIQPFLMDVEWSATWVWHKSTSWVMHVVQWGKQRWDDLKLLFSLRGGEEEQLEVRGGEAEEAVEEGGKISEEQIPSSSSSPPTTTRRTIRTMTMLPEDAEEDSPHQVIIQSAFGDLDGDGDKDRVEVQFDRDAIVWFENGGLTGSRRHSIANGSSGVLSVSTEDVDNDGYIDVSIIGDGFQSWYENDGDTPPGWTGHSRAE